MDVIVIDGGQKLRGEIAISGSKNGSLPLICASLLSDQTIHLKNVPHLKDVESICNLLSRLGVNIEVNGVSTIKNGSLDRSIKINASHIISQVAPYDLVRKMRASVLVLGPLLSRFGYAKVSLPGGCAIGARPVDIHIEALKSMGAEVELIDGYIIAHSNGKLKGAEIFFKKVSVGATENTIMAAAIADGKTIIHNASIEPEVIALVRFLRSMGAIISGEGTSVISIIGVEKLHGTEFEVMSDRIEAGTYAIAAALCSEQIKIKNLDPNLIRCVIENLKHMGIKIVENQTDITVYGGKSFKALDIETDAYPNFPTDLQAQMMALLCLSNGTSKIHETVHENRFMHVPELNRMGAKIEVEGGVATIKGIDKFTPAEVMATDLRASATLILAALNASGKSIIRRVYHLDRGYENLDQKLRACGANIRRISE